MRIVGYIDHPVYKITVFKTDTRLSIKFEDTSYEQTYKFRPSIATNSLAEIKRLVDTDFLQQVGQRFQSMHQDFQASFGRNIEAADDDEFPTII